ncbi:MAG: enoyl-CoA hydratase-related protein, partial [Defluviitaleaceae bacterium]|nr:enoyl-CoA hydratase-related protein [Defluviitaleaceae bacterium]
GVGHASELMFSGHRIDAARAADIGLVNAVYPQAELMEVAVKLANKMGRNAPIAVGALKKAMYAGIETTLEKGLEIEAHAFSKLFETTDAKAGLRAFNNKEKYAYKGE